MKDEILQTALDQFLKFGIREMSIKKLIEPLGISTKTVYKYFKNKEELLEEALLLHYNEQYQMLENLSADQSVVTLLFDIWHFAIEKAFDVNDVFYKDLHYYYPELEQKSEIKVGKNFGRKFQHLISKGIEQGIFRQDLIPEVAMEGIYVLYNAIVRTELFKRFHASPSDIVHNTIEVYIRGLCLPAGNQELEEYLISRRLD